jgi:hypothetical protein
VERDFDTLGNASRVQHARNRDLIGGRRGAESPGGSREAERVGEPACAADHGAAARGDLEPDGGVAHGPPARVVTFTTIGFASERATTADCSSPL